MSNVSFFCSLPPRTGVKSSFPSVALINARREYSLSTESVPLGHPSVLLP
jgi:hypothetical protein